MEDLATELLKRYDDGDVDALGELVELYRRPLYGFILKMISGRTQADDVFQEVWIRAIGKMKSFRKGNFLSWLFRIAHNLIIDNARRDQRFMEPLIDSERGEYDSPEESLPDSAPDPGAATADRETGELIRNALKSLPPEQREVFLMRVDGDLTFKDIAAIQRVSINTALARMQYALEKMRKELKEVYSDR